MSKTETIAAIATPPGKGGVAIIRISGRAVPSIAEKLLGHLPKPRTAELATFRDEKGQVLDVGIVLYFPGPHSFTGEAVLELQGHGGIAVTHGVLKRVLELGARIAEPGEFCQRAYLNNKMDLTQAEAVADLIDSGSQQAVRSALNSLQGAFSEHIETLSQAMINLRMFCEAALDFPDEDIELLEKHAITQRIADLREKVFAVLKTTQQGAMLREGLRLTIIGAPNAGKSSLLNALSGYEAAIVTPIPGTTRDVLREKIYIDGVPIHISDTAGLRTSADVVEQMGIKRAYDEMASADHLFYVIDSSVPFGNEEQDKREQICAQHGKCVTLIYNKIDVEGSMPRLEAINGVTHIYLSAKTGLGLDLLHQHLRACVGLQNNGEDVFMARTRHVQALQKVTEYLASCNALIKPETIELLAEHLRLAHQALMEITGEFSNEDLLGEIFSRFCIGK